MKHFLPFLLSMAGFLCLALGVNAQEGNEDATLIYASDFENEVTNGVPTGWVTYNEAGFHSYRFNENGTQFTYNYGGDPGGGGSRLYEGFSGNFRKALYWGSRGTTTEGYAEFGSLVKDYIMEDGSISPNMPEGIALELDSGEYHISFKMAAWKEEPTFYVTLFDLDYTVQDTWGEFVAAPNVNGAMGEVTGTEQHEITFSVDKSGYYILRFTAAEDFWQEYLLVSVQMYKEGGQNQEEQQIIAPESVFAEEAVLDNWTREFTGDGQDGSFVLNTWSAENDASGVKPPFIESWVGGGNGAHLSNEKIYRTIEDLQPGTYVVNLLLRAYNEMAGSSAPSGVKITANDASVDISVGQEFSYNNMAGIYDNFTISTTVGQDGKLDIAVEVYDANVSWIAFKNLEVFYLGEDIIVATDLNYSFDDDNLSATVISGEKQYEGEVVIPESIEYNGKTYAVTAIGDEAFFDCQNLQSIAIPTSVTSIGYDAFGNCYNLTVHITDLEAWCRINMDAWANPLIYAQRFCLNGKEIHDLVIPESITEIRDRAFDSYRGLTSVTIHKDVTSFGEHPFYNCPNLTTVISMMEEPPLLNGAFDDISPRCVLCVPEGTKDVYIEAGWTEEVFKGGIVEGDVPAPAFEQVGETTVNIASLPNDDYSTKSFSIDMEAIVRALGCTTTDIDSIYAYTADGMLSHDYTAITGFWFNQDGYIETWGNNSRIYIEYANLAEGIYNIGQYAGVYSGITRNVDWNAKIILKYGAKYWTVNVNYTVIAASEWENGQDVTDQLGWGATIADEENIEKPYWKGFEYGIDAPYQWEFRDGSGGERDDYHSWAVYNTPTWNVYQEFEIPAGVYTLKVAGAYREGTTNTTFEKWLAGESTKNAFLYAKVGDEVFETPINYFFYGRQTEPLFSYDGWQNDCHFPDKEGVEIYAPSCHWGADKYLENGNWNWNELIFLVPEKTTIRVGIDKRVERSQDQVWWNDWHIIFEQPYDESALSLVAYNNYLKKENAATQFAETVISKYPTLGSIMQDEIFAFGEDHNLKSSSPLEEIEAAIAEIEELDANNHAAYTSTQTMDFVIDVCEGILKVTDFSGKADFEVAVNQAKSILYDANNTEATVADYLNASDNLNKARITYLLTQPKNDEGAYDFTHAISNPWFVNQEYTPTYNAAKGVYVFPAEVERTWFGGNAPDDETDMERETTDKDGSPLAAVADKAHWATDETAEEQWVYVDNWAGWHGGMKNCIQKLKGYAAFYSGWAGGSISGGGMWVTQVLNDLPEGYYSLEGYVFAQPEDYEEYGNQYMFMNDVEGNELVKVKNENPQGFWGFSQRSEWTQLKSDIFYVPGGKVTVGYHHNSMAGNAGMVLKYYGKEHSIPGDANGDGAVDITDVVCIVNCILGKPSATFNATAADMNGDGTVDVVDLVAVVNTILGKGNQAKARDMEVLSNALTMLSEKDGMNILVEGAAKFAAMQFDVTVSDDATLLDATLNSKSGHQVGLTKIGTNRYRVLAYSLNNANFEPTEDALMSLVLSNGATASIEKATFVTTDGRSIAMNIANEATGIEVVDSSKLTVDRDVIYNLAGQRMGTSTKSLPTGVYIRNGKRILVK